VQTAATDSPPAFLLGAGAQKAGTTWLFRYLAEHDCVDLGASKEYHIWDALYAHEIGTAGNARKEFLKRTANRIGRLMRPANLRYRFLNDPEAYFDYFAGILAQPGITLTGDITPAYSALPAEALVAIRDGFQSRNIPVRVVFLMRDPFERCWSAVRMIKRQGVSRLGVDVSLPDEESLLGYVSSHHARVRTNYPDTLDRLLSVFGEEAVFVGFYESLFTESELVRLSRFLNVQPDMSFVQQQFNTSPVTEGISPAARHRIEETFSAVYKTCAARYPQVKNLWQFHEWQQRVS